ncbi:hypothetical protein PR003_g8032 [Phytophthora rubi]|uniref:Pectate lyase n=1 Tax=Phytophthora rubi TaxID=129364 RepID=A0A6A3MZF8_9STRA|nr:hypothetical protein PR002_g6710 [Phytophthora rubi]KAE9039461.1 hypothetical protein PR001_g7490 [Phytophthora rubi]KAE9345278.1 hypothetical protein PR003_g8032 [Phytophthora rubi]
MRPSKFLVVCFSWGACSAQNAPESRVFRSGDRGGCHINSMYQSSCSLALTMSASSG